jgi:hypothetical protein
LPIPDCAYAPIATRLPAEDAGSRAEAICGLIG